MSVADLELLSEHRCFGGVQRFYRHQSAAIGLPMQFSVFLPPQASTGPVPVLFYLAGLTCTEETFMIKAGAQRSAAALGLMLVTCDTSPRRTGIAGEADDWEFGSGAGFYLDATQAPWATRFRMYSYILKDLHPAIMNHLPADPFRTGIFGHSMGGHGALVMALRNPNVFQSVSAFAPICSPTRCAWGKKALPRYLGTDTSTWAQYDAVELLRSTPAHRFPGTPLVDQGLDDKFLTQSQLLPEELERACHEVGQPLQLRRHAGYDHGYYFIASFIDDHLMHHARALTTASER